MLTLTGPGGTGKTRLALAAADAARAAYREGVCWVELAPVDDPDIVALTVAGGLGARERPGQEVTETIAEHLGDRSLLMVLDNCEHLTAAVAELAARLLRACPALSVLATSREPLGVDGERQLAVPALAESDAVTFFEQRAQLVRPSFRLGPDNTAAVHQVCRRLDGLPLAIELAAARLRILSISQLAVRLDDVFAVLVGGARTAPRRHQTLRATLDWSHDLLDEDERAVFRRLAVFAGGFTLAAAEEVAGGDVLDILTRLADKSLVRVDHGADEARYHLLATVREYARERLDAAGEQDRTRQAHLKYFADFVEQIEPRIAGGDATADTTADTERELNRIEVETPNLRTALEFARTSKDVRGALRIVGPLERYAYLRGEYSEFRHWMDDAVTLGPDAPARLLARALLGGGRLALLQCDYGQASVRLEAALRLYQDLEDRRGTARTLQVLGSVAREQGRYGRSAELHAEGLALAEEAGDRQTVAAAHGYLGFAYWLQKDFDRAVAECTVALAMSRDLGDVEGIAWSLLSLGVAARYTGAMDRAGELLAESRLISERVGFREGVAWSLEQLGLLALARGEASGADLLRRSLEMHRELRDRWRMCSLLADLAVVECDDGDAAKAAALLGAAQALREEIGTVVAPVERPEYDRTLARARAVLEAGEFEAAWAYGQATPLSEVLAAKPGGVSPVPAPVPAASLRIRVLGAAEVYRGESLITAAEWGYAKPRELLFLLATSAPMTRDQVGAALWPDHSRDRLSNALHTALRDLRRALGDSDWIRYAGGKYSFNSDREHECDASVFEQSLAAARRAQPASAALPDLQRAIAAYGGDFLDGLAAGEWAAERRDEYRRGYESALLASGRLYAAAGRHQAAVNAFRRAVAIEPLNESAHRELMTSLVALGETARAVRHYTELAGLLREQVGAAPAAETTALYQRLLGSG